MEREPRLMAGLMTPVKWSIEDSLRKLKLDYVDLFLLHWPIAAERTDDYQPKLGPDGKVSNVPRARWAVHRARWPRADPSRAGSTSPTTR